MFTNIQRYFRYYLALALAALLALGTRLAPAAPLPGAPARATAGPLVSFSAATASRQQ